MLFVIDGKCLFLNRNSFLDLIVHCYVRFQQDFFHEVLFRETFLLISSSFLNQDTLAGDAKYVLLSEKCIKKSEFELKNCPSMESDK